MAHVHHQTNAIHLLDHLFAHTGHARVFGLITAGRQQRLIVVGQLHEPCTKGVDNLDQADVILDGARVLEAEKNSSASCGPRHIHVAGPLPFHDQVRKLFEPAVPLFKIQDRFTEILVIGNCDMDGIQPPLAHLAKDLFRPVAVLKIVDTHSLSRLCRQSEKGPWHWPPTQSPQTAPHVGSPTDFADQAGRIWRKFPPRTARHCPWAGIPNDARPCCPQAHGHCRTRHKQWKNL
mmetsp:Transcript_27102/g.49404  ORF Transcript_27102/g.49404 Transcript_27102/m.49404 type:complete len:234 (-) Transcript_27102:2663-3364(-)